MQLTSSCLAQSNGASVGAELENGLHAPWIADFCRLLVSCAYKRAMSRIWHSFLGMFGRQAFTLQTLGSLWLQQLGRRFCMWSTAESQWLESTLGYNHNHMIVNTNQRHIGTSTVFIKDVAVLAQRFFSTLLRSDFPNMSHDGGECTTVGSWLCSVRELALLHYVDSSAICYADLNEQPTVQ